MTLVRAERVEADMVKMDDIYLLAEEKEYDPWLRYIYPHHNLKKLKNFSRLIVISVQTIVNVFSKATINMKGDCNCSGGSVCQLLHVHRSLIITNGCQ